MSSMHRIAFRTTRPLCVFAAIVFLRVTQVCVAQTSAFDCVQADCGVPANTPYPSLVVGVIDAIATPHQAAEIFRHLRNRGLLKSLPDNKDAFAQKIQPVSLKLPSGHSMTLLMSTEEMRAAPLHVGELARFAPHSNFPWTTPQPDDPYWVAVGCVVELCAKGDEKCQQGYHSAIYHLPDGQELDASGVKPAPSGIVIDNQTMKQVKPVAARP